MSPIKINIIDINALGYAAMYQPELSRLSFNGQPTAGIHGAMASVMALCVRFPEHVPLVLWDGHSHFRYELLPDYKLNRSSTPEKIAIRESYKQQTPFIRQLLRALGIPQVSSRDCEADDIAGWLCSLLPETDDIILSTKDSDWWQGLHPNVKWYSPHHKRIITFNELATTDMADGPFDSIAQYVMAKAMSGDTSDAIPGVPKVGIKTAVKLMKEHGSFEALWAKFDAGEKIKGIVAGKVAGPEFREMYARNMKLIDWSLAPPIPAHTALCSQDKNPVEFKDLCDEFGLTQIAKTGSNFEINREKKAEMVARVAWLLDPMHAPDRRGAEPHVPTAAVEACPA